MKNYLLLALVLIGLSATAQPYFQHVYGTTDDDYLTDGVNTRWSSNPGHFMVGTHQHSSNPNTPLIATHTDGNGTFTGVNNFNNEYVINTSTGTPLYVGNAKCFDMSNGAGFAIVGDVSGVTNTLFYLNLQPNGTFGSLIAHTAPTGYIAYLGDICESSTGNEAYVTGMAINTSTNVYYIFVYQFDLTTGAINWSGIYDIGTVASLTTYEFGKGIMESPYSSSDLYVVGPVSYPGSTRPNDGFVMVLNSGTGAVTSVDVYGTTRYAEEFTCINSASATSTLNSGFVIGGSSFQYSTKDFWTLRIDQANAVLWSSVFDYNYAAVPPLQNEHSSAIVERLNTSGTYEFYHVGAVDHGNVGNSDMIAYKIDENGNAAANGQFTYGGGTHTDAGIAVDYYDNTGTDDGLSIYGYFTEDQPNTVGIGQIDEYHVKAYFNGASGCTEDIRNMASINTGGGWLASPPANKSLSFSTTSLGYTTATPTDQNICFNTSVTGGSNARTTGPGGNTAMVLSPNPVGENALQATVEVEALTSSTVTITVYDMLGRKYYYGNYTVQKGKNQLPINLQNANMARGMYSIRLTGSDINQSIMMLVK